jgi:hypothetical protein
MGQIGAGALEVGSAVAPALASTQPVSNTPFAPPPGPGVDWSAVLKGSATALGATGKLVGAQFSADGIQRDADAAADKASSSAEDRLYQMGTQAEKDASAARDKVADFLKNTLDARNATLHSASNMRG